MVNANFSVFLWQMLLSRYISFDITWNLIFTRLISITSVLIEILFVIFPSIKNFNHPVEKCAKDDSSCVKAAINAFLPSGKYKEKSQFFFLVHICLFSRYSSQESFF